MARSKTIVKTQVRNPKTGKLEWRKQVTKMTNASKGTNNARPYRNEKYQLESERITERGTTERAKRGMLSADIANVSAQAGSAIRALVGQKATGSTEQTQNNKPNAGDVQQLVDGGTTPAANKRDDDDDDDEDSPWVEG